MKIIKFVQPSCAPCRMVDGLLKHLNLKADDTLDIAMDDDAYVLAQHYKIKSTPTLILIDDNGFEVSRVSGMNLEDIKEMFEKRK